MPEDELPDRVKAAAERKAAADAEWAAKIEEAAKAAGVDD